MLTAIVSSKTTVVGIRLDHERRAWVQAEAAREGVSVRAWFERLIDEARTGEGGAVSAAGGTTAPAAGAEAGGDGVAEPPSPPEGGPVEGPVGAPVEGPVGGPVEGEDAWVPPDPRQLDEPSVTGTAGSHCDELRALPVRVVRGSLCLPAALVRQAGRWARWGCRTGMASRARAQALVAEHLGPTA